MSRHPPWIRVRVSTNAATAVVSGAIERAGLNTVCRSALCPNKHECFSMGTATFMILGDVCTRRCGFCAVARGVPAAPDLDEPARVARAAGELGLKHVVITSVTRDDLADGGAGMFAGVIRELRARIPAGSIEVLTPDFKGCERDIATVLKAGPDVFNHNLETVKRLQASIRPAADYERSLGVLRFAAEWKGRTAAGARRTGVGGHAGRMAVKSGVMVGLGETDDELYECMKDLLAAGCEFLTIGQYLAPTRAHAPVARYVEPAQFEVYRKKAREMGFKAAAAGPLVRSSYRAGDLLAGDNEGR